MLPYPESPLQSGRFGVRPWTESDLDCIRQASEDAAIPRGTSVPSSFTPEEGLAFIRRQWSRAHHDVGVSQAIVESDTDRAIGLMVVSPRPQARVAGVGYWVVPAARRRGAASTALTLVKVWSFAALDLRRLEAWVEPDNTASRQTLANAGFELEGRLRNFFNTAAASTDALVYSAIP